MNEMKLPDTILDRAYSVYEEWGPKRRIERQKRLRAEFEQLSSEEIEWLLNSMKEVSETVWDIAKQGGEAKLGRPKIIQMLQTKHPFLKSEGLRQAVFLVNYYAWHEGYDK